MNILIVANHYAVSSARYASAAFERLGHTVRHVGPAMGRNIWGLTLPEQYVWEPTFSTSDLMGYGRRDWPDLTVVMDSDPAILNFMKEAGMERAVVWGVDNHVRDYRRPYFEHYFLAHRNVSVMAWQDDMAHTPCAYDPTLHTPSPIPFEEREYDVACLGVIYPQRMQAINALKEAGFSVIWGMGLVYESFAQAYHNARISLCISSNGDVAQRVFETAALGNVVMTDMCADYQLLKPNGFYLLDDTESETVVQAVRDVLHEPEHAQAMVTQSMAWVSGQTWDKRAAEIVGWYERRT